MAIILGIDGLEYGYVREFECKNLMQRSYGKTDISEYEEPRTIVLWSSFLAGKNLEKEIVSLGKEKMWDFKLKPEETFLPCFEKHKVVDVPGFAYAKEQHSLERKMLKQFFNGEITVEEFDAPVLRYHKKLREDFLADLEKGFDLLFYYFNAVDVIGHLSFGVKSKMKTIYRGMDEIAARAAKTGEKMLILSDHGMKPIGRFGDHQQEYGFWSNSLGRRLGKPRITELSEFVAEGLR